jgi:hypothetical protein
MPRRAHVPEELRDRPFRGTDAVRAGLLTSRQLDSAVWVRIVRDVYVHTDLELDPTSRLRALLLATEPDPVVCGLTAAWLYGAWTPPPGMLLPLEYTRHPNAPGTPVDGYRRRRLILRTTSLDDEVALGLAGLHDDVVRLGSLRVTSPIRTCFDLVRRHALVEAVAFADSFAFNCDLAPAHLGTFAEERKRWPGVRQAREVSELAVMGARSFGESRLRMVVVLAGLGEPLVNPPIHDAEGNHVATPDLLFPGSRPLAMEYDGAYHDEGEQPAKDRRRRTRFVSSTDIPLVEYDKDDVRNRRDEIVVTVERKTGRRALAPLDPAHFHRGQLRWV